MRRIIRRVLAIFLVVLFTLATGLVALHFTLIDGIQGALLAMALREDTVYADGYSNSAFMRIKQGMDVSTVHELLGPPLDHWRIRSEEPHQEFGERWSYSPGDTHFRTRTLIFRDGKVLRKVAEFYID